MSKKNRPMRPIEMALMGSVFVGLGGWIVDRLETRVVGGNRTDIAGALDIVLAAHRIDAGALAADIAGHQRQVAQALHVVDAADVLGNAEGVVDRALVGSAELRLR